MGRNLSQFNTMGSSFSLEKAGLCDAVAIAEMSRDYIEFDLGWSWTPERVAGAIKKPSSVALKVISASALVGFGIMSVTSEKANLNLLAVEPDFRSNGIGAKILMSLEDKALDSSAENFYVQVRESNQQALRFYHRFGYEMIDRNVRYYRQREAAVILYKYSPKRIMLKE